MVEIRIEIWRHYDSIGEFSAGQRRLGPLTFDCLAELDKYLNTRTWLITVGNSAYTQKTTIIPRITAHLSNTGHVDSHYRSWNLDRFNRTVLGALLFDIFQNVWKLKKLS